jgi:hypothetical protein
MGLVPPVPLDVVVAGDRPAFFTDLDLVKNEESDVEGRTIVSDIIHGLCGRGREVSERRLYHNPDMITGHGVPVRFFLTPSVPPVLRPISQNTKKMVCEDGATVERRRRKSSKKETGEYMRRISFPGLPALKAKNSPFRGFRDRS